MPFSTDKLSTKCSAFSAFCCLDNLQGDAQFIIGFVAFRRAFRFKHMFWNFYCYRKVQGDRDWIRWDWRI